jgi:hypothetical protein
MEYSGINDVLPHRQAECNIDRCSVISKLKEKFPLKNTGRGALSYGKKCKNAVMSNRSKCNEVFSNNHLVTKEENSGVSETISASIIED